MDEQKPISPRQRLKELQAVPERERTDAQWDEMNELEISLAAGNRDNAPDQGAQQNTQQNPRRNPSNAPRAQQRPGGGAPGGKPSRRLHKRPPKAKTQ